MHGIQENLVVAVSGRKCQKNAHRLQKLLLSARFLTLLCVLKHGTPHLVTSNEKLESLMEVGGFPVHCGLPCGATLCTFPPRAKIYVSDRVFVSKTPEIITFLGGTQFWGRGGG